jgi:serine O-acetyltransferase
MKSSNLSYTTEADRVALGITAPKGIKDRFCRVLFPDLIWRYQYMLRLLEHFEAQPGGLLIRLAKLWCYFRFRRLGIRLGFSIPTNVFGPGLSIAHRGTIVVNKGAKVGSNCRIHVCVNIGTAAGEEVAAPIIGDNVYIGPGAKIFGPIRIADGCAIGANAVVNKSFEKPNRLLAGVPARDLGEIDTSTMLIRATERQR